MKTAIIAAVMAAGVATAIPATAQNWNQNDRGYGQASYDQGRGHDRSRGDANLCEGVRAQQLYVRIRHEVKQRDLSWREARDLRAIVDRTADQERRACARGMNRQQAYRIDRQYDRVEDMIRQEARG